MKGVAVQADSAWQPCGQLSSSMVLQGKVQVSRILILPGFGAC